MLLVPRQLLRAGMTGSVPYYGGRFSPAQAYAASHRSAPSPPRPGGGGQPRPDTEMALRHLLAAGVISEAEFAELSARVRR